MSERVPFQPDFGVVPVESECRKFLAPWLDAACIESGYPLSTDAVSDLLLAGGYHVTSDFLTRWAANGWCEPVDEFNDDLLWSPRNVYCAMLLARTYRHYDPLSPRFDDVANEVEKKYATARRDGTLAYPQMERLSINEIVVMLELNDAKKSRQLLCGELRMRLAEMMDLPG